MKEKLTLGETLKFVERVVNWEILPSDQDNISRGWEENDRINVFTGFITFPEYGLKVDVELTNIYHEDVNKTIGYVYDEYMINIKSGDVILAFHRYNTNETPIRGVGRDHIKDFYDKIAKQFEERADSDELKSSDQDLVEIVREFLN